MLHLIVLAGQVLISKTQLNNMKKFLELHFSGFLHQLLIWFNKNQNNEIQLFPHYWVLLPHIQVIVKSKRGLVNY